MSKDEQKSKVTILLRGVPEDIHNLIVDEKSEIEKNTGRTATNPEAVYRLIRKKFPSAN